MKTTKERGFPRSCSEKKSFFLIYFFTYNEVVFDSLKHVSINNNPLNAWLEGEEDGRVEERNFL